MTQLFEPEYRVVGNEDYSAEFWNGFRRSVDDRLHALEQLKLTIDGILGPLVIDAQKRIQDVLNPAVRTIQKIQESGFLLAASSTAIAVSEGDVFTFMIDPGDSRDLFTPSTHSMLTRRSDTANHAVLRTISYDRDKGEYRAQVISSSFAVEGYDDWEIVASAGSTVAMLDYLGQALALRDSVVQMHVDIEALKETATGAAETATAQRQQAAGHALNASNARNKAEKWANEVEDLEVEVGKFSSRHYAAKAAASALAAATFDPASFYTRTVIDQMLVDNAATVRAAILGGATAAYDTLLEIEARFADDADANAAMVASIAARPTTLDLHRLGGTR